MYRRTVYAYAFIMLFLFIAALGTGSAALGNQTYIEAVGKQSTYTLQVASARKTIYDCNLQPLTNTEKRYVAAVAPSVENIGQLQSVTTDSQRNEIFSSYENGKPFLIQIESPLNENGIVSFPIYKRYSSPQPASNLIGYLENASNGISGIEKYFNDELDAKGKINVTFTVDALGQAIQGAEAIIDNTYQEIESGIALTIDRKIQTIVEACCADIKKGAAVVMKCKTGRIVALASFPSLDPNDLKTSVDSPHEPFINRALCAYTPGSIFKLIPAAAALENGADFRKTFSCTGSIEIDGMFFSCYNKTAHGEVNMHTALRQSCNGYFIQLVHSMGVDDVLDLSEKFNLGKEIDIGEGLTAAAGTVSSSLSLTAPRAIANFSFGQGETALTPLHAAALVNAIVSDGMYYTPYVFLGEVSENRELTEVAAPVRKRVLKKTTADRLRSYMESTARFGTAKDGAPTNCLSGIKTGTAQTGSFNEFGEEIHNYWYVGYISNKENIPEYTIVIMEESDEKSHVPYAFKKTCETLADFI